MFLGLPIRRSRGGEERIRTSETLRSTVFPGPRTRPTMRPLRVVVLPNVTYAIHPEGFVGSFDPTPGRMTGRTSETLRSTVFPGPRTLARSNDRETNYATSPCLLTAKSYTIPSYLTIIKKVRTEVAD